jgi:hypothetical protein
MKTLMMKKEGEWIEIKKPQLTQEENETLAGYSSKVKDVTDFKNRPEPTTEEQAVIDKIRQSRFAEPSKKDKAVAEKLYNKHKPELKEEDVYDILSFTVHFRDDKTTGILNYRLNGIHKQIRF